MFNLGSSDPLLHSYHLVGQVGLLDHLTCMLLRCIRTRLRRPLLNFTLSQDQRRLTSTIPCCVFGRAIILFRDIWMQNRQMCSLASIDLFGGLTQVGLAMAGCCRSGLFLFRSFR